MTASPTFPWRSERPRWGAADLVAIALWTSAIALYFWDVVSLRRALFYFDITEINYAYRDFLAQEMRLGRFSRWFPGLYCGMPLYSESQAGYWHPLKPLLYPWLKTWQAFNLDTVLSAWLTGLGTYGWLRRHAGPAAALAGAGVFGLSGFFWAHLIHTSMNNALTSVPFAFWALEWAWDRGRLAGSALGGVAIASQVFAGHLQDTLLTVLALGFYTAYRLLTEPGWRGKFRVGALASALVLVGVALSAVQWIPSKELLDRSPRAGGLTHRELTYGSWHPELLPTLIVREAYGTRARDTDWMDGFYPYHEMNAYLGLTAMALAVVGAGAYRDRWVGFWVLFACLGFVMMLGKFTLLFDHAHQIPVLGSSRIPVRFHLWVSLAVAALAAVGVDRLDRGDPVRLRGAFGFVAFLVIASIPILIYDYEPVWGQPGKWNMPNHLLRYRWLGRELRVALTRTGLLTTLGLVAMAVAAGAKRPRIRALATWTLPLVILADLLGSHWFDVPTVPPSYWTVPPETARVIKADPSFIRVWGMAEKSAGEPGFASEPVDFFSTRDTLDWSLPPVWGLASSGGETPIIPRRMLEYTDNAKPGRGRLDIESVTHVVTGRKVRGRFELLGQTETASIYRNAGLPRLRLMGRPYYAKGEADAAGALERLGDEVRRRVIVEDPDRPLPENSETPRGTARFHVDDPERQEIDTDADGPAYLTLSDSFDPGWSATVDGRPATIRPAWVAFRAVYLPAGKHRVVFTYRPAGFLTGLAFSTLGLVAAVTLIVWPRRLTPLGPAHGPTGWPRGWPFAVIAAIVVLVVVSMVGVDGKGHFGLSRRWAGGFHKFTWGAGIEAMR